MKRPCNRKAFFYEQKTDKCGALRAEVYLRKVHGEWVIMIVRYPHNDDIALHSRADK